MATTGSCALGRRPLRKATVPRRRIALAIASTGIVPLPRIGLLFDLSSVLRELIYILHLQLQNCVRGSIV